MQRGRRRVLVVDDELTIATSVAARLSAEGFEVHLAHDGPTAVASASEHRPDLVVLDVMLPGFDGLEVCRRIQAERSVPVIMLTARDAETDLLVGLAIGADDYLTKPFSIRELAARVHALFRRVERAEQGKTDSGGRRIVLGDLEIDPVERRVSRAGTPAHLTPTEFDLLMHLAVRPRPHGTSCRRCLSRRRSAARTPKANGDAVGQSTLWPYISPRGSAISSTRAPSGSRK